MTECAMCNTQTWTGLKHNNGNLLCLKCVDFIKSAHIKVYYPTDPIQPAEAN